MTNYLLAAEIPNWFVVCMGLGTVFVGLICIVIILKILGKITSMMDAKSAAKEAIAAPKAEAAQSAPVSIQNRQEVIAAISAVAAEELGTDISAIRITSFKQL